MGIVYMKEEEFKKAIKMNKITYNIFSGQYSTEDGDYVLVKIKTHSSL